MVQTSGYFSIGTADDGNSRAGGGGGPFRLLKNKTVKSLFGGVVLTFGDLVASKLVCFKVYRFINACQE